MFRQQLIAMLTLALFLLACCSGCKSKRQLCMEEARVKCFGESMMGKPQKFIGSQPVGCRTSHFEYCMSQE